MTLKSQSAIRGVFSVALVNATARVIAYGKHIVITACIGLSAQLDAFYMATTVLAITIFVFGDAFDSVGIPRLVGTLQSEGEDRFRELAGSILSLAFALAFGLGLILLLIAPWTPWIAPGFDREKKAFVLANLLYLAPMAILYLPYHATGSILRARRRFQAFYLGDIVIAGITLGIILLWRDRPYIIPISFSAAYVVAYIYVAAIARADGRFRVSFRDRRMGELLGMLVRLLPVYLVFHLLTLVDRIFASYLPTGGVSALSYGIIIVLIPNSILMMENIFITPLSESEEKGEMIRRIVKGTWIISVPIAFFVSAYGDRIVRVAFERGVFDTASTAMTGDALSFLALAIPAYFLWPILYRLFQILGRIGSVTAVAYLAVVLNASLNYLFMRLGMGIKGLALATSLASYGLVFGSILLFHRAGIPIATKKVMAVLAVSIGIGAAALGASRLVPAPGGATADLVLRGIVFVLVSGLLVFLVPNEGVRHWREAVLLEIFPGARRT